MDARSSRYEIFLLVSLVAILVWSGIGPLRPVHVVARGGAGADRGAGPDLRLSAIPVHPAYLHADLAARDHPDGRRPLHVRARATRLLGRAGVRPRQEPLRPTRALRAGLRAGHGGAGDPDPEVAPQGEPLAALPGRLLLSRVQRVLRADRVLDRARERGRGDGLSGHAGRRLGHAVGHAARAHRRDHGAGVPVEGAGQADGGRRSSPIAVLRRGTRRSVPARPGPFGMQGRLPRPARWRGERSRTP